MFDELGTVAIVDDDPGVLDSLKFLLEVSGYAVAVYPTATEFLEDDHARPSCIILDHQMPGMSGLQLAAKLHAEGSNLSILLITGMPSPEIAAEAQRLGIERVLEKPPYEDDILRFVAAHQ
jgi:two-component system, LuxR family, response regulator FixJ